MEALLKLRKRLKRVSQRRESLPKNFSQKEPVSKRGRLVYRYKMILCQRGCRKIRLQSRKIWEATEIFIEALGVHFVQRDDSSYPRKLKSHESSLCSATYSNYLRELKTFWQPQVNSWTHFFCQKQSSTSIYSVQEKIDVKLSLLTH